MKAGTFFKGAWNGLRFVYQHPQILEIAAAVAPGAPGLVAAGIATVVKAAGASKAAAASGQATPPTYPPLAEPLPPPPPPPPPPPAERPATPDGPPPFSGLAVVPEVDLVGKWRGTLDRMAMEILGYRMSEDELYNNAKLLERGDVDGVTRNLDGKKSR